jgi:hypothetical protein
LDSLDSSGGLLPLTHCDEDGMEMVPSVKLPEKLSLSHAAFPVVWCDVMLGVCGGGKAAAGQRRQPEGTAKGVGGVAKGGGGGAGAGAVGAESDD